MSYTKGKWEIKGIDESNPSKPYVIIGCRKDVKANFAPIAYVIPAYTNKSTWQNPIISAETEANAYLIAAVPTLLEACEDLVFHIINNGVSYSVLKEKIKEAQQAIALAKKEVE